MKPLYRFLFAILLLAVTPLQAAETRVALVVGNSTYPSSRLDNPKNDATAMAATFRRLGFDVELIIDASKADFDAAQKRFAVKADKATAAVLFYAGHGIQANNFNYLVPIDAKPQSERDLKREMVKLDDIIDDMGNAKVKLVFFDACRDNPLARSFGRGGTRGMAAPNEASGTLISFATKHGNTASDGEGKHSPYTESLLAALENPTEEVHALLRKKVQEAVKKKTQGQQEPWAYGNLNGDFYFIQGPVNITVNPAAPPRIKSDAEVEQELWDSIKDANSSEALNEYLKVYPNGRFVAQAKVLLAKFRKDTSSRNDPLAGKPASNKPEDPETTLWRAVENGNDADDYQAYLSQYPKGKYAALAKGRITKLKEQITQEARKKEENQWQAAENNPGENAYQDYLVAYPNGHYALLARNRLKKLQDERAVREENDLWRAAESGNSISAVNTYLTRYPTGNHIVAARAKLVRLEEERLVREELEQWKAAEAGSDRNAVNAYMTRYPEGKYLMAAKEKLIQIAQLEKEEAARREEDEHWRKAEKASDIAVVQGYLERYPSGRYLKEAKLKHADLDMRPGKVFKDCADCPEMVIIPAGSFQMGGSDERELPIHQVTIAKPFAMGKTEVTQGQWRSIMGSNPSHNDQCGDNCPVEKVNWNDAQKFIARLNAKTGKQYRLPSEAEWEYACRAGGRQEYCGSDSADSVAWYGSNSGSKTHSVAGKRANTWGLHDMSGNVWEWTQDCSNDSFNGAPTDGNAWMSGNCDRPVLRGGAFVSEPKDIRATNRNRYWYDSTSQHWITGFRLARTLP